MYVVLAYKYLCVFSFAVDDDDELIIVDRGWWSMNRSLRKWAELDTVLSRMLVTAAELPYYRPEQRGKIPSSTRDTHEI